MNGVLVVDKPPGPTSHDIVARVRRVLAVRRVGHTGTLDPFASGVLPLCLGKATRLASHLTQDEKVYRATVRFGFATTTDDLTGQPLGPACAVAVDSQRLHDACARLTGAILQRPPTYSAKRIDGRRAHDLARRGVSFEPTAVTVHVSHIGILSVSTDTAELEVRCSAGTYIRSIARDLGAELGVGGHVVALRRLACGAFTEADAVAVDQIEARARQLLIPLRRLLAHWPAVRVGADGLLALRHGRDLTPQLVLQGFPSAPCGPLRVIDDAGELVALATPKGFPRDAPRSAADLTLHPDTVLLDP